MRKRPYYKVWAEIERHGGDDVDPENLAQTGEALPVCLGVFGTLEEAQTFVEDLGEDVDGHAI